MVAMLGRLLDWWTRHASMLALPILIAFVCATYFDLGVDSALFCAEKEACVREWVSALSGYFALGAAALTVVEMAKQRRLQNDIQRQNVELTVMGRLAIAYQYRVHVIAIYELCNEATVRFSEDNIEKEFDTAVRAVRSAKFTLKYAIKQLQDERISIFEQQIGTGLPISISVDAAQSALETISAIEEGTSKAARVELAEIAFFLIQVPLALKYAISYTEIGAKVSGAFIQKWEPYVST